MVYKRIFRWIAAAALLGSVAASAGGASAWSGCAKRVVVQWGDTLSGMAVTYGVSMDAIRLANPGLGWWLYAGQTLCIPAAVASTPTPYPAQTGGNVHVVQKGETLGSIALRYGVSVNTLLDINPKLASSGVVQPGQVINLPSIVVGAQFPFTPSPGTPTPGPFAHYSFLKVTYRYGLLVRTGPGKTYSEIVSPFVSAVKNTNWRYNKDSLSVDAKGFVWAEVALDRTVNGHATGWIMVRDQLGNYFTEPHIDP